MDGRGDFDKENVSWDWALGREQGRETGRQRHVETSLGGQQIKEEGVERGSSQGTTVEGVQGK